MDSEIIRELIEKAREGDNVALGQLIDQFRPLLIKQAREQLDSDLHVRADSSDVIQQTCLEIHRDFQAFRGDGAPRMDGMDQADPPSQRFLDYSVARIRPEASQEPRTDRQRFDGPAAHVGIDGFVA